MHHNPRTAAGSEAAAEGVPSTSAAPRARILRVLRRVAIAGTLAIVLGFGVAIFSFATSPDLKTRATGIYVGMPRADVEKQLGKPILTLQRLQNRGWLLCWVDQYWQLDIYTGPDNCTESIGFKPSDSMYNDLAGRVRKWLK
jgi:hypothetical protein